MSESWRERLDVHQVVSDDDRRDICFRGRSFFHIVDDDDFASSKLHSLAINDSARDFAISNRATSQVDILRSRSRRVLPAPKALKLCRVLRRGGRHRESGGKAYEEGKQEAKSCVHRREIKAVLPQRPPRRVPRPDP